jgi:hypothetical protein
MIWSKLQLEMMREIEPTATRAYALIDVSTKTIYRDWTADDVTNLCLGYQGTVRYGMTKSVLEISPE